MKLTRTSAISIIFTSYCIVSFCMYRFLIVFPPIDVLGDSYRLFFFHIPTPLVGFFAFTVTLLTSIMYLRTRDFKWDDMASSSVEIGFVFSGLAIATGWAFSYEAWNTTWSWDPKVMTIFVLWLVYLGYFSLRRAIDNAQKRASSSAVYGIVAYLSVPLTYMSTRMWTSLHPEGSIGLTSEMGLVAALMVFGFLLLYAYLLWFGATYKRLMRTYELLMQEAGI